MRGSAACLVLATFFVLAASKDAHGKVRQQKTMTLGKAQQKKMTPYVEETETNQTFFWPCAWLSCVWCVFERWCSVVSGVRCRYHTY